MNDHSSVLPTITHSRDDDDCMGAVSKKFICILGDGRSELPIFSIVLHRSLPMTN